MSAAGVGAGNLLGGRDGDDQIAGLGAGGGDDGGDGIGAQRLIER